MEINDTIQKNLSKMVEDQVKRSEENKILREAAKILIHRNSETMSDEFTLGFVNKTRVRVKLSGEVFFG